MFVIIGLSSSEQTPSVNENATDKPVEATDSDGNNVWLIAVLTSLSVIIIVCIFIEMFVFRMFHISKGWNFTVSYFSRRLNNPDVDQQQKPEVASVPEAESLLNKSSTDHLLLQGVVVVSEGQSILNDSNEPSANHQAQEAPEEQLQEG